MNLDALADQVVRNLPRPDDGHLERVAVVRAALAQVRDEALEEAAKASWIEPISKAIRAMKGTNNAD